MRKPALRLLDFYLPSDAALSAAAETTPSVRQTASQLSAFGFGWCLDMSWIIPPDGDIDPVFNVRWAGSTVGGPDGNLRWGVDDADAIPTSNSVHIGTHLSHFRGGSLGWPRLCGASWMETPGGIVRCNLRWEIVASLGEVL